MSRKIPNGRWDPPAVLVLTSRLLHVVTLRHAFDPDNPLGHHVAYPPALRLYIRRGQARAQRKIPPTSELHFRIVCMRPSPAAQTGNIEKGKRRKAD
mmetsp:Transcript_23240/g.71214  ORF Transcript_23240/g.71214 Transcript_23240/m.71214 type:complete len:97 (+) Transcript_23240:226-516(+)|eukprot:scaffold271936_cov26-Tisochrysis_lutea.AAC.2